MLTSLVNWFKNLFNNVYEKLQMFSWMKLVIIIVILGTVLYVASMYFTQSSLMSTGSSVVDGNVTYVDNMNV